MIQSNPDTKLKPRRSRKPEDQAVLVESCTVSSIYMGMTCRSYTDILYTTDFQAHISTYINELNKNNCFQCYLIKLCNKLL